MFKNIFLYNKKEAKNEFELEYDVNSKEANDEELKLTKVNDFVFSSPSKLDCPIVQESMEKFFRTHGFKVILVPHGIR